MIKSSKYFAPVEFTRCTPACTIDDMDQGLLDKLDALREKVGIPLILNCAYRSVEWDKSKGRSGAGAHPKGKAVDIRCYDSGTRFRIVRAAMELGFARVGIEGAFVHVDTATDLPQNVMWTY